MAGKVKGLETWCRKQTTGYKDVHITNMTSSWRDGLAFCALIHKYRPDLIDFDSLSKGNVLENNQLAFKVANEQLNIPALLDAEDMVRLKTPDRLSIVTYVSQYYNCFKDKKPEGGPLIKKKFGNESAVKKQVSAAPAPGSKRPPGPAGQARPAAKRSTLGDTCAICKTKVYLIERHILANTLYHRSCFRDFQSGKPPQAPKAQPLREPQKPKESPKEPLKPVARNLANSNDSLNSDTRAKAKSKFYTSEDSSTESLTKIDKSLKSRSKFYSEDVSKSTENVTQSHSSTPAKRDNNLKAKFFASAETLSSNATLNEKKSQESLHKLDTVKTKPHEHEVKLAVKETARKDSKKVDKPIPSPRTKSPVQVETNKSSDDIWQVMPNDKKDPVKDVNDKVDIPQKAPRPETRPKSVVTLRPKLPDFNDKKEHDVIPHDKTDPSQKAQKPETRPKSVTSRPKLPDIVQKPDKVTRATSEIISTESKKVQEINVKENTKIEETKDNLKNEPESKKTTDLIKEKPKEAIPEEKASYDDDLNPFGSDSDDDLTEAINSNTPYVKLEVKENDLELSKFNENIKDTEEKVPESIKEVVDIAEKTAVEVTPKDSIIKDNDTENIPKEIKTKPAENEHNIPTVETEAKVDTSEDISSTNVVQPSAAEPETTVVPKTVVPPKTVMLSTSQSDIEEDTESEFPSDTKSELEKLNEMRKASKLAESPRIESDEEQDNTDPPKAEEKSKSPPVATVAPMTKPGSPKPKPRQKKVQKGDLSPPPQSGGNFIDVDQLKQSIDPFASDDEMDVHQQQTKHYDTSLNPFDCSEDDLHIEITPEMEQEAKDHIENNVIPEGNGDSYDDSLNPFGDDDDEDYDNSMNPFAGEPDDNSLKKKKKRAPLPPTSSTPMKSKRSAPTPPRPVDGPKKSPPIRPSRPPSLTPKKEGEVNRRKKSPAPPRPPPPKREVAAEEKVSIEEIEKELHELDERQTHLENKGRELEDKLRQANQEQEEELMIEWFVLVNEKNDCIRAESELMYQQKQQDLETKHEDIEFELRTIMMKPDHTRTDKDRAREAELMEKLVEIVEKRNSIVESMDEDRIRFQEADEAIHKMMSTKGATESSELGIVVVNPEKIPKKEKKEKKNPFSCIPLCGSTKEE
ncbi:unnamed protein product [Owenia fusiformis]|uniref:Uncharacterized protein n=1 Tax=Owenia fusiformis TaxID=6347 RepID=A0A8J1UKK5_OWEFU|nr:unnamed protein product [Owenia fusiformis]